MASKATHVASLLTPEEILNDGIALTEKIKAKLLRKSGCVCHLQRLLCDRIFLGNCRSCPTCNNIL